MNKKLWMIRDGYCCHFFLATKKKEAMVYARVLAEAEARAIEAGSGKDSGLEEGFLEELEAVPTSKILEIRCFDPDQGPAIKSINIKPLLKALKAREKKPKLSAAARMKIARTQRERWAKQRRGAA